jgi:hypothetical protein
VRAGGLGGLFGLLAGVRFSIPLIAAAGFGFMFTVPIMTACAQAIWQRKVEPDLQGRVFSARRVISWCSGLPAMALAGPLVDGVFGPLMASDGPLAGTALGALLTLGPGRDAGVVFMLVGVLVMAVSAAAYLNPLIRRVETLLPDAAEPPASGEAAPAPELEAVPEMAG